MNRDEVSKKIRWPAIIWLVGIVNPFFMIPQLWTIWNSGHTEGISIITLLILVAIQSGFALHGFFLRDRPLMISNGAAAIVTTLTAISTIYFRV